MPDNMIKILSPDQIKAIEDEQDEGDDENESGDSKKLEIFDDPEKDYFKIGKIHSIIDVT